MRRSVALTGETHEALARHLLRADRQEDLCFATWRPSTGATRVTALLERVILPQAGERHVHGTASFESAYFRRAAAEAAETGGGLAFLHSHPRGRGWQGMSVPDVETEQRHAKRALAVTNLPLVGLTIAGDRALSARFWERTARASYSRADCTSVRVAGEGLSVTFNDGLVAPPRATARQVRTVSAWGDAAQRDWTRLRIAIVGAGTVGSIIADALARMGATRIVLIDHDTVEEVNLDRLLHATMRDVRLRRAKVDALARALAHAATAEHPELDALDASVVESDGLAAVLDADVIFSCVDRPWPRAALNYVAYAHLIPVIDVGVRVSRTPAGKMRNAIWRAHIAMPGRPCLECLGQYDSAHVQLERDGSLDDPAYIQRLPKDSPLRARQNVFAFALGAASLGLNQLISLVIAPGGVADVGALRYQLKLGRLDGERPECARGCPYAHVVGNGDRAAAVFLPAGPHPAAEQARRFRAGRWHPALRRVDDGLQAGRYRLERAVTRRLPQELAHRR